MISFIEGKIIHKTEKSIVIQTGGVGYMVFISPDTISKIAKLDENISLWTYMAVRENSMDLYGFETIDEKNFFELLLEVSGIGPKSALSILSLAPIEVLKKAIGSGDITYLTKVSGIGKKTAEKIVVELRDKLASLGHKDEMGSLQQDADVLGALESLGYSMQIARGVLKEIDSSLSTNEKIKEALKILGR